MPGPIVDVVGARDVHGYLQNRIDAESRYQGMFGWVGRKIYLGYGVYKISQPLHILETMGLEIVGQGSGTLLYYDGPDDQPIIRMQHAYRCTLRDMMIMAPNGCRAHVQLTNHPPEYVPETGYPTTGCKFINLHCGGPCQWSFEVFSRALGGVDANNDFHYWDNVISGNYYEAAWVLEGANVHGSKWNECHAIYDPTLTRNGALAYGLYLRYGSFVDWHGGFGYGNDVDFFFADFMMKASISNFNGEQSKKFFETGGPTSAYFPLSITDSRWEGYPPDGIVGVYRAGGTFHFARNRITAYNGQHPRIHVAGFADKDAEILGNAFDTTALGAFPDPIIFDEPGVLLRRGNKTMRANSSDKQRWD